MDAKLEKFVGVTGEVNTDSFIQLTRLLDCEKIQVIKENERGGIIETIYQIEGRVFELWYQVKTPYDPMGIEYAYGFEEKTGLKER